MCVSVQAPHAACSLWHHHNPIAVCFLTENSCFAGRPPQTGAWALLWDKIGLSVFYAARLRQPLNCDVSEHFLFLIYKASLGIPKYENDSGLWASAPKQGRPSSLLATQPRHRVVHLLSSLVVAVRTSSYQHVSALITGLIIDYRLN